MNKPKKWLDRINNSCLHEKIVICSLALLVAVLSFDCFFKSLPVSGYALIFITLIVIGGTTWGTCHGIKWLLHCNQPLMFYTSKKSQNEILLKIVDYINKTEDAIFDNMFKRKDCFDSFYYPTSLNEQVRLFLKDLERDFVKPWYSELSQNPSFLFDTHLLLEEILFKIVEKLRLINSKNLLLNVLMLYLNHLQEYKKSMKKIAKAKTINDKCDEITKPKSITSESFVDFYRYSHPSSRSDEVTNYFLKKVTKWIIHEYAPQEFAVSLQCKILTGILARKVLRECLNTVEDPIWINIKLIHLLDISAYNDIMQNKSYCVKEKVVEDTSDMKELHVKQPIIIKKRYMKSSLFNESRNLFQRMELGNDNRMKCDKKVKSVEKENLNLSLQCGNSVKEGQGSHISSVLGGIISSTAGPLLPDDASLCYEPLNKMWQSPVTEKPKKYGDPIAFPYGKTIVEGLKMDTKKTRRLSRSKSTDSVAPGGDVHAALKVKDVSIGEELCENARFTSTEDVRPMENIEEDCKSKPRGVNTKKLVKTRSFDSGSVGIDSNSIDGSINGGMQDNLAVLRCDIPKEAGDVSPVYEESEDFASTIAKLRSLLQQRESSSTLSDKSVQSIDLPSSASIAEPSDSSNKTQSTDLDNSSFDSQVIPDIPMDGRPFVNVCIPKTELLTDGNGVPYVLYSVQYDGLYRLKEANNSDSELVLQTTVVKRRFQEFINLQSRLEECSHSKAAMKGVRGPAKWLNLNFSGKGDESSAGNRKQVLEHFLQQLCSKVELCASPELQEFLAYGCSTNKIFVKKDTEPSGRRIDKLLTNKVTDVFNTIKTALPSFDFDSSASISVSSDTSKGSQDQKLLPGFLSFGNKTDEFEVNFDYKYKEHTGEALTDDIRRYFNQKTDGVESGMDVLDSNDWLSEKRECRPISSEGKCIWHNYRDHCDEDLDPLDSWLPVYSIILDIICELLDESDSWVIREPVIRLIKVITGHWETKIEERLSKLDWDQIMANVIRLIRTIIFQTASSPVETIQPDEERTRSVLKNAILASVPDRLLQFIKFDDVSSAVGLFVDSFQHFRSNRDVALRLVDILLVQLLSCPHLDSS